MKQLRKAGFVDIDSSNIMAIAWSPKFSNKDFPMEYDQWLIEDKIKLFEDQTIGWQLEIADDIINKNAENNRHAGFAILAILFSYFEMIGKYIKGANTRESKKYFRIGLLDVFPEFAVNERIVDILYSEARCGMYHQAIVGKRIVLSRKYNKAIVQDKNDTEIVVIDPHSLTTLLIKHFNGYIGCLKKNNTVSRQNFITRFDYLKRRKVFAQN